MSDTPSGPPASSQFPTTEDIRKIAPVLEKTVGLDLGDIAKCSSDQFLERVESAAKQRGDLRSKRLGDFPAPGNDSPFLPVVPPTWLGRENEELSKLELAQKLSLFYRLAGAQGMRHYSAHDESCRNIYQQEVKRRTLGSTARRIKSLLVSKAGNLPRDIHRDNSLNWVSDVSKPLPDEIRKQIISLMQSFEEYEVTLEAAEEVTTRKVEETKKKPKIPGTEADRLVEEYLKSHANDDPASVTVAAIHKATGVSAGNISGRSPWQAFFGKSKKTRKVSQLPTIPLREEMLAVMPNSAAMDPAEEAIEKLMEEEEEKKAKEIQKLIDEQERDKNADERPYKRRRL